MSKKKRQKKYNPNKSRLASGATPLMGKRVASKKAAPWQAEYVQIIAMQKQNDITAALTRAEKLLQQYPGVEALQNITAILLAQNHRYKAAIKIWQSIADSDKKASIQSNIGRAYLNTDLDKARQHLQQALTCDAEHIDALLNMGVVLQRLKQFKAAIAYYEKVLEKDPKHLQTLFNLATIYQHQLDFQSAYRLYEKVLQINPAYINAQANLVFTQHYVTPHNPALIAERAIALGKMYAAQKQTNTPAEKPHDAEKRLHIGLVSADLRDHPVGYFIEGLLTSDAVKQFDWSGYANTPIVNDLTQRIQPTFSHWHHIDRWSDERVIEQIRTDGVDILIDLSGLTASNRIGIFAAQAAPLQLTWLGYFGTTGLPTMQGIIADPYCVPASEEKWFSERVWRLPHSRLCFTAPDFKVKPNALPALRNGYMTFGCFQNLSKINDEVLQVWAKIAKQCPEAHWTFQNNRLDADSADLPVFKQKLLDLGFPSDKLHFYGATPRLDYFQAHHDIDIILDTFPYPGGTTTAEALWMGVPTISFTQAGMLARQGEQLLSAAGLSDWVCQSSADYIEKAVYWNEQAHWQALNEQRLALREQVINSPLFDSQRFADDWCALIREIWRNACE